MQNATGIADTAEANDRLAMPAALPRTTHRAYLPLMLRRPNSDTRETSHLATRCGNICSAHGPDAPLDSRRAPDMPVFDPSAVVSLASQWRERPSVLSFLRHFG
jgi:hypothetical protein